MCHDPHTVLYIQLRVARVESGDRDLTPWPNAVKSLDKNKRSVALRSTTHPDKVNENIRYLCRVRWENDRVLALQELPPLQTKKWSGGRAGGGWEGGKEPDEREVYIRVILL